MKKKTVKKSEISATLKKIAGGAGGMGDQTANGNIVFGNTQAGRDASVGQNARVDITQLQKIGIAVGVGPGSSANNSDEGVKNKKFNDTGSYKTWDPSMDAQFDNM